MNGHIPSGGFPRNLASRISATAIATGFQLAVQSKNESHFDSLLATTETVAGSLLPRQGRLGAGEIGDIV